jgi:hypothetical protein
MVPSNLVKAIPEAHMKIIDYKLIHFSHYDHHYGGPSLDQKVKAAIAEGWQPIGGPVPWDSGDKMVQAMVRYE